MPLFGRKRSKGEQGKKKEPAEEYVICPHCYLDYTVDQVRKADGVCPSCKGKIDLDKQPRAHIK